MDDDRPRWAYLFEHAGADPDADRLTLTNDESIATVVAVPDVAAAREVAAALAAEGVTLVELCGGFGVSDVAAVRSALPDGVALGHVTFAADSLLAAADYARPQPGT